jgi:tetratricopeptide (TPR) repeat protein
MKYLIFLFISLHLISSEEVSRTSQIEVSKLAEFQNSFEVLAKNEKWEEILSLGSLAFEEAKKFGKIQEEAKICAQLTSTCFYQGNYPRALEYVHRCHQLSEELEPSLFLRALYLESAIYRAFAGKSSDEANEQALYLRAVETGEKAVDLYLEKGIDNTSLKGKIYFNLGAGHADNPKGNLYKAIECYSMAIDCFRQSRQSEDLVRTYIRLGKVRLLQSEYNMTQEIIDEIRPLISSKRIAMHLDYLEAQLRIALKDFYRAKLLVEEGLSKAEMLGANEDYFRFMKLKEIIHENELKLRSLISVE